MSLFYKSGKAIEPRKTFETPCFLLIEDHVHTAMCVAAIKQRRLDESAVRNPEGEWVSA